MIHRKEIALLCNRLVIELAIEIKKIIKKVDVIIDHLHKKIDKYLDKKMILNEKKILKNFLKNGYFKFQLDKKFFQENLKLIKNFFLNELKIANINLEDCHKFTDSRKVNGLRLKIFNRINQSKKIKKNIFLSAEKYINFAVGSEICSSDANLSIQLPEDKHSLLQMHTDFFSGESQFQANLWFPMMNVSKTQSMFIINPKNSISILKEIKSNLKTDFDKLDKKYKKQCNWIKVKKGEAIIFSPNCLHGNVVNNENKTRVSINIRYKNLFSPFSEAKNEKFLGTFYNVESMKAVTKFNLQYEFNKIIKQ